MHSSASQVLHALNDQSYSLTAIQQSVEDVLDQEGYQYRKNGSSEIVLEGSRGVVRDTIIKNIPIPKMVLEAIFSFYQCGKNVYIRTTLQ